MVHFYTVADLNPELSLFVDYDSKHRQNDAPPTDIGTEANTIFVGPIAE